MLAVLDAIRVPRLGRGRPRKRRNVVERCINRLKDFRAVAIRVDKHGLNFLACVILASIFLWIA